MSVSAINFQQWNKIIFQQFNKKQLTIENRLEMIFISLFMKLAVAFLSTLT